MRKTVLLSMLAIALLVFVGVDYWQPGGKSLFRKTHAKTMDILQAEDVFNYDDVKDVKEKKQRFFDALRPVVINENQKIRDTRTRLESAMQSDEQAGWIAGVADQYDIEWDHDKPQWDTLLRRVDTLPVELVLSQAANESAWGQSRFAQQANNLFGQWCFDKGCGIVPEQRDAGKRHEVAAFDSINESVSSYMHNLNRGNAYRTLRKMRSGMRKKGQNVDALRLAEGLEKYSSRGDEYVREIQSMIKTNRKYMLGQKPGDK